MDQNCQNIVWIKNSRTTLPTTTLMLFLSSWDILLYKLHCKRLQRILQCFTVKLLQRTTVSTIYSELLLFFNIYFCQILCFLQCKMSNVTIYCKKYREISRFFNRQIRASILPTKYCKFCIFYNKPVIFFTGNCIFFI